LDGKDTTFFQKTNKFLKIKNIKEYLCSFKY